MRRLLYVPIIHTASDLGSMAPSIERGTVSLLGERRWASHKAVVAKFWQVMAAYLAGLEATNLKIYQDGLSAGGELGRRIVTAGAERGSDNYGIILDLIGRGAEVRATEDSSLLREEYGYLSRLAQQGSPKRTMLAHKAYESSKERLTRQRDKHVAATINATLKEGEVGLLFMGAYHNVLPYLAEDIIVEQLKEQEKVQAYFKGLLEGAPEGELEALASYLVAPMNCR